MKRGRETIYKGISSKAYNFSETENAKTASMGEGNAVVIGKDGKCKRIQVKNNREGGSYNGGKESTRSKRAGRSDSNKKAAKKKKNLPNKQACGNN